MHLSTISSPSLIISVADKADALNVVLSSIARQTVQPREVIVADESRDDQCAGVIRSWATRLPFPVSRVDPGTHIGRAPLLNAAIRQAGSEYLIFIQGDCLLHRRFIADHIDHAAPGTFVQGRRAGIRARYVRRISPSGFHPTLWILARRVYGLGRAIRRPWPIIRTNDLRTVHGCNFAAWRDDVFRVNGFDQNFDDVGVETLELATRLRNCGLTLNTITGRAIVYHLDHRHLARYRSVKSARILQRTTTEKLIRCEVGLITVAAPIPAIELIVAGESAPQSHDAVLPSFRARMTQKDIPAPSSSQFRDKIVPRSMLARFVQRCL